MATSSTRTVPAAIFTAAGQIALPTARECVCKTQYAVGVQAMEATVARRSEAVSRDDIIDYRVETQHAASLPLVKAKS